MEARGVNKTGRLFYVPLGAGLPVAGLAPFIAALLAFLGTALFFLRDFFRRFFRKFSRGPRWVLALIVMAIVGGGVMVWKWLNGGGTVAPHPKVLILGIDGLDPKLLDTYMGKGLLPNFVRLREQGMYSRLGTTTPPESPVAWSTFATGCNPGKHGLFDFVRRTPHSYLPDLALVRVNGSRYEAQRQGEPFWSLTSEHGVPTTIIRCPITFPPEDVKGHMLSGMGVPDLRGSQGTFSYWTTEKLDRTENMGGRVFSLRREGNRIATELSGPSNRKSDTRADFTLPFLIELHPEQKSVTLTLNEQTHTVKEKEWSPWYQVTFKVGFLQSLSAICRFYVKSITPEFALYGSPLNFDPDKSPYPISYPKGYAKELANAIGLYHTLGMPEDTWALNEERIDEQTFLEQCQLIYEEREKMLWYELGRWQEGVLTIVFDTVDRIQHMFWRFLDDQHPLYDPTQSAQYGGVIEEWYRKVDSMLGRVLDTIDEKTILVVLSDHGFSSFRRAVHLNSWLRDEGFLRLKSGRTEGRQFGQDVDWGRSRAYAIGIGGIYLNLQGREPQGVVSLKDAQQVKTAISKRLLTLVDPKDGAPVVRRVLPREDIYNGPETDHAPDLFVGFAEGYRASWQTALGGTPRVLVEDNTKKWSGDHIVDPELVPGILLINRPLEIANPTLEDIAPTILQIAGVQSQKDMDGASFWREESISVTTVPLPSTGK